MENRNLCLFFVCSIVNLRYYIEDMQYKYQLYKNYEQTIKKNSKWNYRFILKI
jgi:hypothetical protein